MYFNLLGLRFRSLLLIGLFCLLGFSSTFLGVFSEEVFFVVAFLGFSSEGATSFVADFLAFSGALSRLFLFLHLLKSSP